MNNTKKYFLKGEDGDSSLQSIEEGAYLRLMNGRVAVGEYTRDNQVSSCLGTTLTTSNIAPPYGNSFPIGSCVDPARGWIISAMYNSFNDHFIQAYDPINDITYCVIYDTQVVGTLNLSKTYRIDRNMYVVGDLLIWTDNNNEIRCLNYIAGIKANTASFVTSVTPYWYPIKYQSSTLIVRPPIYPLTVAKQTDGAFLNNFTQNQAYEFTYQYVFRDFQTSALSSYSALVPYNFKTDTFNSVLVKVPFAEFIDYEILYVYIYVKYGNTGSTVRVKTWDRNNTEDLRQINSHNLGLVQLQFVFYDTIKGITLDSVSAATSFSNVPLKSETMAIARNRVYLSNNTMGYTTPVESSLSATQGTSSSDTRIWKSGTSVKISIEFKDRFTRKTGAVNKSVTITMSPRVFSTTTFTNLINWLLSNANALNEIPLEAYYYQILVSKNLTEASYIQGMTQNMYYATKDASGLYQLNQTKYNAATTVGLAIRLSVINSYGMGYTFTEGDFLTLYRYTDVNYTSKVLAVSGDYVLVSPVDVGRVTNSYNFNLLAFSYVNTADTAFLPATCLNPITTDELIVQSAPEAGLNLDPPDLGKVNYIMDNLTFTARNFTINGRLQFTVTGTSVTFPNIIFRVYFTHTDTMDVTSVDFYTQSAVPGSYNVTFSGIAANIPAGYNRVTLLGFFPDVVTVNFISGEINFNETGALNLFEIYTPMTDSLDENYYQYGSVYDITNPATSSRQYSTLSGSIIGDSYKVARTIQQTSYFSEAMSPNDNQWQFWQRDIGWFNTIDRIGQQTKKDSIAWSDTYISGTQVNGFSSFQPLNQKSIGLNGGGIQKILLTNKRQEDGTVMLIWTENDILSAYLGEVQLVGANANDTVATTSDVIGTINALKTRSGTIHPESVIDYNGMVWWFDAKNGWWSEYNTNGVDPVSKIFKMDRFFKRYASEYQAASTGNLDNINGFHHIGSMLDPMHKRVMPILPGLIYPNYATNLPSYSSVPSYASSIINRFDIYDNLAKTMSYDFINNKWNEDFEFLPEWSDYVGDKMYGWKNGRLYKFDSNTGTINTFFGTQYPLRICFTLNVPASAIKDVFNIKIEGNKTPNFTVLMSTYPNTQLTDLSSDDYTNVEGEIDAMFYRDRLSPNTGSSDPDVNLYKGDYITGETCLIMLEYQEFTELLYINAINIGWQLSRGHNQILNK